MSSAATTTHPSAARRARSAHRRQALLVAWLALVAFVPFAAAGLFPSVDGPSHLNTAGVLAMLRAGTAPTAAAFIEEADPGLSNLLAPWLLSRLLDVMDPMQAEWTLALALAALLLASALLAVRLLGGRLSDAALGALLCAPIMLYWGSFSLVFGYGFGFAALAFAAGHLASGRGAYAGAFAAAALVACASNIQVAVPLVAAVFGGIAGAVGWRWLRGRGFALPRPYLTLALAALPVVAWALAYKLRVPDGQIARGAEWKPLQQLGVLLLRADLVWFWYTDVLLLAATTLAVAAAAAWWLLRGAGWLATGSAPSAQGDGGARTPPEVAQWAFWAAVSVTLLALVLPIHTFAMPVLTKRIAPFAHFLVFLWFIAAALPLAWRRAVVALALATGLAGAAARTYGHAELADRNAELLWAERQIPAGAVVDLVNLPWLVGKHSWTSVHLAGFRVRFDPFAHLGRGLHGRDLANIENYQLIPVWNIFRVRPRPELASVIGLGDLSAALRLGFVPDGLAGHRAQLRAATGGRDIDFLVVWKGDPDLAVAPELRGLLDEVRAHLNAEFALVGRSAPHGRAEVWQRRQPPDAAAKRPSE